MNKSFILETSPLSLKNLLRINNSILRQLNDIETFDNIYEREYVKKFQYNVEQIK